jgi:hypothetical protein
LKLQHQLKIQKLCQKLKLLRNKAPRKVLRTALHHLHPHGLQTEFQNEDPGDPRKRNPNPHPKQKVLHPKQNPNLKNQHQ